MKSIILAVGLLGLTAVASADNTIRDVSNPYNNPQSYCVDKNGDYRLLDEYGNNAYIDAYGEYEPWQYMDENGYDYTVIIKVE